MESFLKISARSRISTGTRIGSIVAILLTCTLGFADDPTRDDPIPPSPIPALTEAPPNTSAVAEQLARDRPLWSVNATLKAPQGEMPSRAPVSRQAEAEAPAFPIGNGRPWMATPCEWDAPCTRNLPLYFENANLERAGYTNRCYCDLFGHETDPYVAEFLQPVISGAHFVGRIPILPIMMCQQPPCEPIYTLGVDRPGSPVCYRSYRCPICFCHKFHSRNQADGQMGMIPSGQ